MFPSLFSKLVRRIQAARVRLAFRICDKPLILARFSQYAQYVEPAEILRALGADIGRNVHIEPGMRIQNDHEGSCDYLHIGDHVYIGPYCLVDLASPVRIENDVAISGRVSIITHGDVGDRPLKEAYPRQAAPVTIEHGAWIGTSAVLLHGVSVGECSIVGAMSLVNRDVPPWTMAAGVPCRPIKTLERGKRNVGGAGTGKEPLIGVVPTGVTPARAPVGSKPQLRHDDAAL